MTYEELFEEIKKTNMPVSKIRYALELDHLDKLVKTQREFDEAILKMAKDRVSSNRPKTINNAKNKILKAKIIPKAGRETEEIRDRYGISIHAWDNLLYYRKSLLPT